MLAIIFTQDAPQPELAKVPMGFAAGGTGCALDEDPSSEETFALQSLVPLVVREFEDLKRFEEGFPHVQQHCDEAVPTEEKERATLWRRMQADSAASFKRHILLMESVNTLKARLLNQPSAEETLEERRRSLQLCSAVEELRGRMSALEERADSESTTRLDIEEQLAECRLIIGIKGDVPSTINNVSSHAASLLSDLCHHYHQARLSAVEARLDDIDAGTDSLRVLTMERCAACEASTGKSSSSLMERISDLTVLGLSGASAPSSPSMPATPESPASPVSLASCRGADVAQDVKAPIISISGFGYASAPSPVATSRFLRSAPRSGTDSPSKLAAASTSGSRSARTAVCPGRVSARTLSAGSFRTPQGGLRRNMW